MAKEYASQDLREVFLAKTRHIEKIVEVLSIYHYHAVTFRRSSQYYPPSLLKASALVGKLADKNQTGDKTLSDRNVRKLMSERRDAAVLIYSSNKIRARPFSSLLEALRNGAFAWCAYSGQIIHLLERAKYIQERLVPMLYQNEGLGKPIDLEGLAQRPFRAPAYLDWQAKLIQKEFGRHAQAKGGASKST